MTEPNTEEKFSYTATSVFILVLVLLVVRFMFIGNKDVVTTLSYNIPLPEASADYVALQSDITKVARLSANLLRESNLAASAQSVGSVSVAKERKAVLKRLARKNPGAFLSSVIPAQKRNKLSVAVQAESEKDVNLTGELSTIHVDDFSNPANSYFDHYLSVGSQRYELYSILPINIPPGTQINVSGISLDNVVVANASGDSVQETRARPKLESTGSQKTAVFLVDFLDSGPRPFTAQTAHTAIFNGRLNKFYDEQSYGSVKFKGEVFGWYTLPRNAPTLGYAVCGAVDFNDIADIIAKNRIRLNRYDRLVIIPSHPNLNGGCSGVGKWNLQLDGINYYLSISWIGNATSYNQPSWWGNQPFPWTNLDYILSHELGHSLGVWHANGWDCGDESLYGACSHIEYGNFFDTMGTVGYSLHFNALYKDLLGWFRQNNVAVISQSSTVNLKPLEKQSSLFSNFQAIKIQQPGTLSYPYYIEYRQGIGFDLNLNRSDLSSNKGGVFINKRIGNANDIPFPRLIDATPTALDWYDDIRQVTLNSNSSFTDSRRGITVTTKSANSTAATVEVTFTKPECVRASPKILIAESPKWQIPTGQYAYIYTSFRNTDYYGCGPSTFRSMLTVPLPLKFDPNNSWNTEISVTPEEESYYTAAIFVPEDTPAGQYPVHYEVANITDGSSTGSAYEFILDVCELSSCPATVDPNPGKG